MFHSVQEVFPPWCFSWNGDSLKAGKGCPRRAVQPSLPPQRPFGPGPGRVSGDVSSPILPAPRQVGLSSGLWQSLEEIRDFGLDL